MLKKLYETAMNKIEPNDQKRIQEFIRDVEPILKLHYLQFDKEIKPIQNFTEYEISSSDIDELANMWNGIYHEYDERIRKIAGMNDLNMRVDNSKFFKVYIFELEFEENSCSDFSELVKKLNSSLEKHREIARKYADKLAEWILNSESNNAVFHEDDGNFIIRIERLVDDSQLDEVERKVLIKQIYKRMAKEGPLKQVEFKSDNLIVIEFNI